MDLTKFLEIIALGLKLTPTQGFTLAYVVITLKISYSKLYGHEKELDTKYGSLSL